MYPQEGEQAEHGDSALRLELRQLQARRMLRTLAVVQDLADAMLALNDVRGAFALSPYLAKVYLGAVFANCTHIMHYWYLHCDLHNWCVASSLGYIGSADHR